MTNLTNWLIGGFLLGVLAWFPWFWTIASRSRGDDHLFLHNIAKGIALPAVGASLGVGCWLYVSAVRSLL